MKKIMFALVAVAMATVASASTFTWGIGSGALDTAKFASGTAYLFYALPTGTLSVPALADKTSGTYSQSDITASGATLYGTGTLVDGKFLSDAAVVNAIDSKTGAFKFYMAVISDDGKYAAVTTGTKTARIMNGTTAAGPNWSASNFNTYSVTSSDPTPEPTSGLLLLVGGAMLALRRKQK